MSEVSPTIYELTRVVEGCVVTSRQGVECKEERVAWEAPVHVSYNENYFAPISCTPDSLEDFAFGSSFALGIITNKEDIAEVHVEICGHCFDMHVTLRDGLTVPLDCARLSPFSECPLEECILSDKEYAPLIIPSVAASEPFPPEAIWKASDELLSVQELHRITGSSHAASFVSRTGEFVLVREDVGRHNAVDKVIGAMLRQGIAPHSGFLFLSSRCALELVNKAAKYGIGMVATISAPTSAVVSFADEANVTLCAFARNGRFTVYSHPERIAGLTNKETAE